MEVAQALVVNYLTISKGEIRIRSKIVRGNLRQRVSGVGYNAVFLEELAVDFYHEEEAVVKWKHLYNYTIICTQ